MLLVAAGYCWVLLIGAGCCWVLLLGAAAWVLLGAALGSPGFSWAPMGYLGALFGSLLVLSWGSLGLSGRLWASPGLSWASLGPLLGCVGALLDPKSAPRGPQKHPKDSPRGLQEPSSRGLLQRPLFDSVLGNLFLTVLGPILGPNFVYFGGSMLYRFCC